MLYKNWSKVASLNLTNFQKKIFLKEYDWKYLVNACKSVYHRDRNTVYFCFTIFAACFKPLTCQYIEIIIT